MVQYIDKSALVAEIEKRIEEYKSMKIDSSYYDGMVASLEFLRDEFINTLEVKYLQEEPVSEDLDMEIDYYLRELQSFKSEHGIDCYTVSIEDMDEICRHFAEWQEQQDQSIIELAEDHAILAGMEKMREQLMKDAVDAKVTARWPLHSSPLYYSYEIYVPYAQHLSEGDNVKILIIKKEDN